MTNIWPSFVALLAVLLFAATGCPSSDRAEAQETAGNRPTGIPLHGPRSFVVKYLGVTCGHMTLESTRADYRGKGAYHIVMTARNSKFFNKIYKVDARIESWLDAETLTSLAYLHESVEKGERSSRSYSIDHENKTVTAIKNGERSTFTFETEGPVLDPMAFVYRLCRLADTPNEPVTLTLLTDKGPIETVADVSQFHQKKTADGLRLLLQVRPRTADGEMFSRKGEFSLWVDPQDDGALHKLDFDLSFGHLVAKRR